MVGDHLDKKAKMVDAAERLFTERGYDGTSVTDICSEVGAAHSLFYYYFDKKEDIVEEITRQMIDELQDILEDVVDNPKVSAEKKFILFMSRAFQSKKDKPYLASYFAKNGDPKIYHRLFNEMVENITSPLAEIVKQGMNEGVFDTKYPERTIRFWLNGRMFLMNEEGMFNEELLEDMKAEAYMLERLLGTKDAFLMTFYEDHEDQIKEYLEKARRND